MAVISRYDGRSPGRLVTGGRSPVRNRNKPRPDGTAHRSTVTTGGDRSRPVVIAKSVSRRLCYCFAAASVGVGVSICLWQYSQSALIVVPSLAVWLPS